MNSDQSDSNKPKTIEALVPMVDLFAMLAIMFMIYSTDEITYAKQESQAEIQKLTEQVEEVAEEQAKVDRRKELAQQAEKTLEQLKAEQAQAAQALIQQFTSMVAAQQSQAAAEYQNLVAKIELEHDEALEQEATSLQEQTQAELEKKKNEVEAELAKKQLELEEEKEKEIVVAKLQFENELSSKVSELTAEKEEAVSSAEKIVEETKRALAETDQQLQALATQKELELAQQKQEMAKVEQTLKEQAASQAAKLQEEKERALAEAEAEAEQERQRNEAEKKRALAKAEQERERLEAEKASAVAEAEADAEKERQRLAAEKNQAIAEAEAKAEQMRQSLEAEKKSALAKAEKERKKLEAEKAQALAKADEAEKLASETEQYLTRVVDELNPFLKAEDAKQEIVKRLKENFKDIDSKAVEIDEKTGKVRLHFEQTYFARGSHELSEDMKSFLRIMIPKYAKSIYENKHAAKHVDSLKISGMTSPIYRGKYIDLNSKSYETEKARRYNMKLSNKRAMAMYNFIFDEKEMKNFKYRDRLKADMGIAALGFQNAAPVKKHLVGKPADCKEYDCKHEQATVLQFHLYSEN